MATLAWADSYFSVLLTQCRLRLNARCRWLGGVLLLLSLAPTANAEAEPVRMTSGFFDIGRPLIGTAAINAALVWANPPSEFFGPLRPEFVYSTWETPDYTSTLLGTTAPVRPLVPGAVPVGGTFVAPNVSLAITGGTFLIPSVFPPTDDSEGLYTLTEPFTLAGHWLVEVVTDHGLTTFDRNIVAHGHARLVLGPDLETGHSILSAVIYDFEGAAPVPEPATLLLVTAGTSMLALVRRRGSKPRMPVR